MLATTTFASSSPHNFLPIIPSPLSPRRGNLHGRRDQPRIFPSSQSYTAFMNSTQSESAPRTTTSTPFSQRPIKSVPAASNRPDALRERRRDMFLKKVRQEREDKRWDNRVEDMARLDYKSEKSRWEAEQARLAPPIPSDPPEEDEEDYYKQQQRFQQSSSGGASTPQLLLPNNIHSDTQLHFSQPQRPSLSDWEADAVLAQENAELEALVAMMEGQQVASSSSYQQAQVQQQQQQQSAGGGGTTVVDDETPFGSDDDEYDSIFMGLIDERGGLQAADGTQGEAMDMS